MFSIIFILARILITIKLIRIEIRLIDLFFIWQFFVSLPKKGVNNSFFYLKTEKSSEKKKNWILHIEEMWEIKWFFYINTDSSFIMLSFVL